jgi:hypothetical protein
VIVFLNFHNAGIGSVSYKLFYSMLSMINPGLVIVNLVKDRDS